MVMMRKSTTFKRGHPTPSPICGSSNGFDAAAGGCIVAGVNKAVALSDGATAGLEVDVGASVRAVLRSRVGRPCHHPTAAVKYAKLNESVLQPTPTQQTVTLKRKRAGAVRFRASTSADCADTKFINKSKNK
jgi:hypothetical protein